MLTVADGEARFSITLALDEKDRAAGKALPQILVVVTGLRDVEAAALARPRPAAEVFPAILSEMRRSGHEFSAIAKYFQLGG